MRLATFYGPAMRSALAPAMFIDKIHNNSQIDVHGSGNQTRTMTYVYDIVDGIIVILNLNLNVVLLILQHINIYIMINLNCPFNTFMAFGWAPCHLIHHRAFHRFFTGDMIITQRMTDFMQNHIPAILR